MACLAVLLALLLQQSSGRQDDLVEYAVVVHPDNPTKSVSSERLRHIFRAEVQQWSDRETIELLMPRSGTGVKHVLLDRVYDMTDLQLKRYWTRLIYQNEIVEAPPTMPSPAVALRVLERTRGSITVVPVDEVPKKPSFRIIAIDEKTPGTEGYPLVQLPQMVARSRPTPGENVRASDASVWLDQEPPDPVPLAQDEELLERVATLERMMSGESGDGPDQRPSLNLHFFAHMEAEIEREMSGGETSREGAFSIEVLDMLTTSALTDRLSVLTETVIEAQDEGDYEIEIERLLLKYRFSDALNIQAGRFLTTLGYWNSRYHHGEWLQTSIDRPEVLDFEDDSGLLPIHNVGIRLKGAAHTDVVSVDYALEVANGRGPTPDTPQVKLDENDMKAWNLSVGVQPSFLPGLRVGGGVYLDDIPANDDDERGPLHGPLEEIITNVYCAYDDARWELMAEYFDLEHDDGFVTTDSSGWYVQVGRHIGDWTPYARFDGLKRDDNETFWDSPEDSSTSAFGIRYDVAQWASLTAQYEHADTDAPPGDDDERTRTFVIQASFTF